MLILEGMQAGVSWGLILNKEAAFRKAFDGFDPELVAAYDETKVEELMQNAGIIRNRNKTGQPLRTRRPFWKCRRSLVPSTAISGASRTET